MCELLNHLIIKDKYIQYTYIHGFPSITRARTEYELKEISVLPDCVKELQPFEGQQEAYLSWVNRAQSILTDYDLIKTRPLYRAIVLHIRRKIKGRADMALEAYGVQDDDWEDIKCVLALNYAGKRDIRTLEHELSQGSRSLNGFYMDVNGHLSLILNNLKAGNHSRDVVNALIETYRDTALDVFIRGVGETVPNTYLSAAPRTYQRRTLFVWGCSM